MESLNLSGSIKDCIVLSMICNVKVSGKFKFGMIIVEVISGNIGIGLVMLCAKFEYKFILTMFEMMSFEWRVLVICYGV